MNNKNSEKLIKHKSKNYIVKIIKKLVNFDMNIKYY
jgi:hypothetical protein